VREWRERFIQPSGTTSVAFRFTDHQNVPPATRVAAGAVGFLTLIQDPRGIFNNERIASRPIGAGHCVVRQPISPKHTKASARRNLNCSRIVASLAAPSWGTPRILIKIKTGRPESLDFGAPLVGAFSANFRLVIGATVLGCDYGATTRVTPCDYETPYKPPAGVFPAARASKERGCRMIRNGSPGT
jgi:hypothetical protein